MSITILVSFIFTGKYHEIFASLLLMCITPLMAMEKDNAPYTPPAATSSNNSSHTNIVPNARFYTTTVRNFQNLTDIKYVIEDSNRPIAGIDLSEFKKIKPKDLSTFSQKFSNLVGLYLGDKCGIKPKDFAPVLGEFPNLKEVYLSGYGDVEVLKNLLEKKGKNITIIDAIGQNVWDPQTHEMPFYSSCSHLYNDLKNKTPQ